MAVISHPDTLASELADLRRRVRILETKAQPVGSAVLPFGVLSDIQPVGSVAAAGSTGRVADAAHVHEGVDAALFWMEVNV
jgi:hypothetical protein